MAAVFIAQTIKSNQSRSCGNCTKCCDGWLTGTIHGIDMYPGKPCHLVKNNFGCTDYENRPDDPCKRFSCLWLINNDIPEYFKPNLSEYIIVDANLNGIDYVKLASAGKNPKAELVDWIIEYAISHGLNIWYEQDGKNHYQGSQEFIDEINKMGYN